MRDYLKVGEVGTIAGIKVRAVEMTELDRAAVPVEYTFCEWFSCALQRHCEACTVPCAKEDRDDGKDVYFKNI